MQTKKVIETIRWIERQYSEETKHIMFSGVLSRYFRMGVDRTNREADLPSVVKAMHELSMVGVSVRDNSAAMQVLQAFGLLNVVDSEFIAKINLALFSGKSGGSSIESVYELRERWWSMMRCAGPLERLTTPADMMEPKHSQNYLSIDIRYPDSTPVRLSDFAAISATIEDTYELLIRIYSIESGGHLAVARVDSGSTIRIDFKGVAEVIQVLGKTLKDAYYLLRFHKIEEALANNRVILSTLDVMDRINDCEGRKSISSEEGQELRVRLTRNLLILIQKGALPSDVPDNETVDNTLLLQGFNPLLLEAPTEVAEQESNQAEGKPGPGITKKAKRSSSKGRKTGKRPPVKNNTDEFDDVDEDHR
jgi:hypothetical protein